MKIDLAELKRIASRSKDIETELSEDLTRMNTTLDEICTNVQSSELTESNQNLTRAIADVSSKIQANLPTINEFLNSQIASYEATNISTKQQIDNLISSVNSTFE